MQKSELIDQMLHSETKFLKNKLILAHPSLWQRYQNHIYGGASILGIVLTILFYVYPDFRSIFFVEAISSPATNTIQTQRNTTVGIIPPSAPSPFKMNHDHKRRDALLSINTDWKQQSGGTFFIDNVNLKTLELLFSEKFIDPKDRQNDAPTANEFLAFMQSHPNVIAHGYAVSPTRKDYRITIEGLNVYPSYVTQELKIAFLEFSKGADEIVTEQGLWCWWD